MATGESKVTVSPLALISLSTAKKGQEQAGVWNEAVDGGWGWGWGEKVPLTSKQSFVWLKHLSSLLEEFTVPTAWSTELGVEMVGVGVGVPKSQEVLTGMSTKKSSLQNLMVCHPGALWEWTETRGGCVSWDSLNSISSFFF